jgi:hypothetical protein
MMLTTRRRRDWLNALLHAPLLSSGADPLGGPVDWLTHAGLVGGRLRAARPTPRSIRRGEFDPSRSWSNSRKLFPIDSADVDEVTVLKITYPTAGVERSNGSPGPRPRRPGV